MTAVEQQPVQYLLTSAAQRLRGISLPDGILFHGIPVEEYEKGHLLSIIALMLERRGDLMDLFTIEDWR